MGTTMTKAEVERALLDLSGEARRVGKNRDVADRIALAAMAVNLASDADGPALDETRAALAEWAAELRERASTNLALAWILVRALALLAPHQDDSAEPTDPDEVALHLADEAKQAKVHDPTHVLIEGWARLPLAERASLSNVAALLSMAERHVAYEMVLRQPSGNQALIGVLRRLVKYVVGHYVVGVFSLGAVADEQRKQDAAMTELLAAPATVIPTTEETP